MNFFRRLLKSVAALVFLAALASPAKANQVYLANSQGGSGSGLDCADALAANSYFNNAANWSSTPTGVKIGPGTTVNLCGSITLPAGGSLVVQLSGTNGNPVWVLFQPNAVLQAPYFGLGGPFDFCNSTICGAIDVNGMNYVVIDGGTNGVIQNTANGTNKTFHVGSVGLYLNGSNVIARNLTITHIYDNVSPGFDCGPGTSGAPCDIAGQDSADVVIDSSSTNTQVCNNELDSARMSASLGANDSGFGGYGTQASCQTNSFLAGVHFYLNTTQDHAWDASVAGGVNPQYIYANHFTGNHFNWTFPANDPTPTYHMDGLIIFGYVNNVPQLTKPVIWGNTFDSDVTGAGNDTAYLFCTVAGGSPGSGCAATAFTNLFSAPSTGMVAWTFSGAVASNIDTTSVSGNTLTITGNGNVGGGGTPVLITGMTTHTEWNNQWMCVDSSSPGGNTNFTIQTSITITHFASGTSCNGAPISHANYGTTADTGLATNLPEGPVQMYYNTLANVGGPYFGYGTPTRATKYFIQGNAFELNYPPGASHAQNFYFADDFGTMPASNISLFDYNAYQHETGNTFGGPSDAWNFGAQANPAQVQPFSAWQTWCSCDTHSLYPITSFNLNATTYRPTDTTLLAGINMTSSCTGVMAPLCFDHPAIVGKGGDTIGTQRPTSGPWYIGAFMPTSAPSPGVTPTAPPAPQMFVKALVPTMLGAPVLPYYQKN